MRLFFMICAVAICSCTVSRTDRGLWETDDSPKLMTDVRTNETYTQNTVIDEVNKITLLINNPFDLHYSGNMSSAVILRNGLSCVHIQSKNIADNDKAPEYILILDYALSFKDGGIDNSLVIREFKESTPNRIEIEIGNQLIVLFVRPLKGRKCPVMECEIKSVSAK